MILSNEKATQAALEPPTTTDAVTRDVPVIAVLGQQNLSDVPGNGILGNPQIRMAKQIG